MQKRIVVIGSGFGGLAAAARLAASGHEVTLLERLSPSDAAGYQRFLAATKPIFDEGFSELADVPFLAVGDMLRVAPDLLRLRSHQSVYRFVSSFIEHDFLAPAPAASRSPAGPTAGRPAPSRRTSASTFTCRP